MRRSRTTIPVRYPSETLSETESGDDSEYLKLKLKKLDRSNNNHNIISNGVKAAMCFKSNKVTDEIDPMSKQWQPKVSLNRLSEKIINKMLRTAGEVAITTKKSMEISEKKLTEKKVFNGIAEISPIKFDKDESVIKEFSPVSANDMFAKRLKTIRDMMIMNEPKAADPQKRKRLLKKPNPELVEYEETKKRLHGKTQKKEFSYSGGRKLYNHGDSFKEFEDEAL